MKDYIFHEGTLPSDFILDYETAIFNLQSFNLLQDSSHWISFYVLNQKRKKADAGIHFHVENRLASSPFRAPFGSVEFSKQLLPQVLFEFLKYIEIQLNKNGINELSIKNPPQGYNPGQISLLETFLLNQNYVVSAAEVSALIQVTDKPFADVIRHSEKLRMHQAQRAEFIFNSFTLDKLEEVYHFLSQCHAEKGYKIPMTLGELSKTTREFKDQYLLFVILHQEKIAAASVSIRINKNTLYNFFANHEREYNQLSPMILLIDGMYAFCRENNITLLDLGTSAREGIPNFKLLDFKIHMGGIPSSKLTFSKKIM